MARDAQHYQNMMRENPDTSVGVSLAAAAVYAARYGICEAEDRDSAAYRQILRDLMSRYGESLSASGVLAEMDEQDAWRADVVLTTEHAASSYGLPVLVLGGTAYGPGDVLPSGETAAEYVGRWSLLPERTADDLDLVHAFLVAAPWLVARGDIAQMAGVTSDAAGQWEKRGLLPEPIARTSGGRIWLRRDIEHWLRATGRIMER